jgi:c-di-GMP-binding flagellar brake protein YcgR
MGKSDGYGVPPALAVAVRDGTQATILLPGNPPISTRFERLNQEVIVLRAHPEPLQDLTAGDPLTVSFLAESRVVLFMTTVHSVKQAGALRIDIPESVFAEMRRHPRIQVGHQSELQVRARVSERQWRPWLGDLSLGGARLCFDEGRPEWGKGQLVQLDMLMHLEAATAVGLVVRLEPDAVGLRFQPIVPESLEARALARLIHGLECERRELAEAS